MTMSVQKYQVAHSKQLLFDRGGGVVPNYRLSGRLQESIRVQSTLSLNFSAPRFGGPDLLTLEEQTASQEEEEAINIDGEYKSDAEVAETPSAKKGRWLVIPSWLKLCCIRYRYWLYKIVFLCK